jgi:ATPase subunit of ABC transporter with duplicated ATPase domains
MSFTNTRESGLETLIVKWLVEQNRYTTKHHAILSRIDHMEKVEKPKKTRKLSSGFDSGGYTSKEIVSIDSVKKSYGGKVILDDTGKDLFVNRNDSIALVGANGCGKTTLLKMIMGEEPCDSGMIRVAPSVKCAYLPQIVEFEDDNATILETLRLESELNQAKVRSILAAFHFGIDDINKKVSVLSGGERSRLKLCLLMQSNVNFLLLDEPTNHLDVASREWIENVLTDFDGAMLFVSHDRYFLNKFADKVWSMEKGLITKHDFGFDKYLETMRLTEAHSKTNEKAKSKPKAAKKSKPVSTVSTELLISKAETELESVNMEIESNSYEPDSAQLNSLYKKKQWLGEKIDSLYDKWLGEG